MCHENCKLLEIHVILRTRHEFYPLLKIRNLFGCNKTYLDSMNRDFDAFNNNFVRLEYLIVRLTTKRKNIELLSETLITVNILRESEIFNFEKVTLK